MVFAKVGQQAQIRPLRKLGITLLALVIPPMAAVRETLYQSEDPWVVDHSKFVRAFGGQPTPHDKAIVMTLSWFVGGVVF